MKKSFSLLVLGAIALALLPYAGLSAHHEAFLYVVFHWVALATSWNLLSGYSGYFSFGHGAFFGIGMYTTGVLSTRWSVPFLWTLPAAALLAALFAWGLGAIAFRVRSVRGELFALLSLAATFVVATLVLNTPIDGGSGIYLSGVAVPALAPTPSGSFYLMALGMASLTMAASLAVAHSRLGLGLFAIHDDEDAAEVMGVPTYRYKLIALALSSGLAGAAGGVHALFVSYLTTSDTFGVVMPLTVVLMAVLGGMRHWAGPAVGAAGISALLFAFTSGDNALTGKVVLGALLIVVILFLPDGLLGRLARRRVHAAPAGGDAQATPTTPPQATERGPEVLLRTEGLSKAFSGVRALDGVDVAVHRGEILGLLGPNGSGKSTFINVVSGHYLATGGQAHLDGRPVHHLPAHRVARHGVSRTYQIPRPFAGLTVLENVALTAMFGREALPRARAEAEAWQWLAMTGLTAQASQLPAALTLHQRKFLEFARALAARPRLLMLDEVLSGLTPAEIDGAVAMIQRIRDQGTTILFVEHVMRAVNALCDRVVVFHRGTVLACGVPADVFTRPEVVTAYLGQPAAATAGTHGVTHA